MEAMNLEVRRAWGPVFEETPLSDGSVSVFAFHPLIPGVTASGATKDEAIENWQEAMTLHLMHCQEFRIPPPPFNRFQVSFTIGTGKDSASQDDITVTAVSDSSICA